MSKSSKTLKDCEVPDLHKAQQQAAKLRRLDWVHWMRDTYSFALAVKMAKFMGFSTPNLSFYRKMRQAGQELLKTSQQAPPDKWGLVTDIDPLP